MPKVIDFGVAKATELTERTLFTQYGTMVGTLEYAGPGARDERRRDTRSILKQMLLYERDGQHAPGSPACEGCGFQKFFA